MAFLDRNVGACWTRCARLNLEEDTLVVYMADHGYSLGQHGRFEKHCCYDPALRVPLIMRLPGRIAHGRGAAISPNRIDVPPTIFDMLGARPAARRCTGTACGRIWKAAGRQLRATTSSANIWRMKKPAFERAD